MNMDQEEPVSAKERFKLVLRQLSSSKESIQFATKILLDNVDECEDLFPILMKRLKKVGVMMPLSHGVVTGGCYV
jgi:hypothetical protein